MKKSGITTIYGNDSAFYHDTINILYVDYKGILNK